MKDEEGREKNEEGRGKREEERGKREVYALHDCRITRSDF